MSARTGSGSRSGRVSAGEVARLSVLAVGAALLAVAQSPPPSAPSTPTPRLVVAPAELEPGGSRLINQGTFAIGSFKEKDLAKFDTALRAAVQPCSSARDAPVWELYAVLRSYMMRTTSSSGQVIACAAWCLADADGRILFHEQFFAAGSVTLIGTAGMLKKKVDDHIVQRIARRAAVVCTQPDTVDFSDEQDQGTFDDFASALAKVPALRVFESSHLERVEMGSHYWRFFYRLSNEVEGWDWAAKTDFIDWPSYITSRRQLASPRAS